ncbi:unnamed protein product [Dicrocoelium dendriticum]|nr:unnamed protein product [Dicrocoelium dendriticum]
MAELQLITPHRQLSFSGAIDILPICIYKIHREDPRFPSLAGLDEFGSPTSGGLQASPPSPCVDDLHRPHTSKSSDVDVVTDDDENEDEEDDDGTESSSHGSCTPPGGVSSISQTSVLTAACESGSWPFVANRLTLSPVLKPPLRDLAPDKLSSIENAPSSFSHQRMDSIASLEDEPVTESPSKENVDGEHSTTDLASSPVTSTDDRSHTHGSPTNGFSPVATTPPSFTESELNVLQVSRG